MKNIVVLMNIDEFVCKTKEIGMKLEGMKNDVKNFILDQTHVKREKKLFFRFSTG